MAGFLAFLIGPIGRWILAGIAVLVMWSMLESRIEQRGWDKRDAISKKAQAAAEKKARDDEAAHDKRLTDIGTHYKKEFEDAEIRRKADVDAARRGALRLRIPGAVCPVVPGAAASPSRSDGEASAELPGPVAADLLTLAHDADEVVRQLASCQAVVESDRRR